jgi:hypothetical protein
VSRSIVVELDSMRMRSSSSRTKNYSAGRCDSHPSAERLAATPGPDHFSLRTERASDLGNGAIGVPGISVTAR